MARPKLGDSESMRLQMVITEEEIAAIDDWRFKHRVPSRSEAIRRLLQIGLRTTRAMPSLANDISAILDLAADGIDIPELVFRHWKTKDLDKAETDSEIAQRLFDKINEIFNHQHDTQSSLNHFLAEIAPLANNPRLDSAIREANDIEISLRPSKAALEAIGEPWRAQVERWEKRRAERRSREAKDQS